MEETSQDPDAEKEQTSPAVTPETDLTTPAPAPDTAPEKSIAPGRKWLSPFWKRELCILLIGVFCGAVGFAIFAFVWLRANLIQTYEANIPCDEMVRMLPAKASGMPGWTLSREYCQLPGDIAVFKLCHKTYSGKLLMDPEKREVGAILPCSFALYGTADGKTRLVRLNVSLVGWLLGGDPAVLFPQQIVPEQEALFESCGFQCISD